MPVELHIGTGGVEPITQCAYRGSQAKGKMVDFDCVVATEKCMFAGNQNKCLGHIVNEKGRCSRA